MDKDIEDIIKYLEAKEYDTVLDNYNLCTIDFCAVLNAGIKNFADTRSDYFVTLIGYPIIKSKEIIGFVDIKTKRRIVNHLVSGYDEYGFKEFRDIYSGYGHNLYLGIGDVGVRVLPLVSEGRLHDYNQYSEAEINDIIDSLESYCLEVSCPIYDSSMAIDYYNQEIYICPLNQESYLLVSPISSTIGVGYQEIVTGHKIIKIENPSYHPRYQNQFMYLDPFKKTKHYIEPIDICKKATRVLTPSEIEKYKSTSPETINNLIVEYIDGDYSREQSRFKL